MRVSPDKSRLERIEAWGMTSAGLSYVYRPTTIEEVVQVFDDAYRFNLPIALKGGGNSYGDAFLCSEGIVIDFSRMRRILSWDPKTGIIECEPGVTIKELWQYCIEDGWWLPVVSGTSFVTIGGALSANIHGKNNFHAGPIGEYVLSFQLLTPSGNIITVSPELNPELFYAVIGGFGLLGCIVSARIQMKKIYSGFLKVKAFSVKNWSQAFQTFDENLKSADYLVGWIDGFASGKNAGRGLIHSANYLQPEEDPHPEESLNLKAQALSETVLGWISRSKLHRLMKPWVNNFGMRFINAMKYRGGKRESGHVFRQSLAAFNFLLDSAPNWKWCYKPGGLIQYQPFIPEKQAPQVFEKILTISQERGLVPYLCVMKRHKRDSFLLSHSVDGYSLALDYRVTLKNRERVWSLARALDEVVLDAGGRFYFAKDSTLTPHIAKKFLGEDTYKRLLELKQSLDPDMLLQSDLSRRVFGNMEPVMAMPEEALELAERFRMSNSEPEIPVDLPQPFWDEMPKSD